MAVRVILVSSSRTDIQDRPHQLIAFLLSLVCCPVPVPVALFLENEYNFSAVQRAFQERFEEGLAVERLNPRIPSLRQRFRYSLWTLCQPIAAIGQQQDLSFWKEYGLLDNLRESKAIDTLVSGNTPWYVRLCRCRCRCRKLARVSSRVCIGLSCLGSVSVGWWVGGWGASVIPVGIEFDPDYFSEPSTIFSRTWKHIRSSWRMHSEFCSLSLSLRISAISPSTNQTRTTVFWHSSMMVLVLIAQ